MQLIKEDSELTLQVIATGMHFGSEFGATYENIETDGFDIDRKVEMLLRSDSGSGTSKSVGLGVIGMTDALSDLKPDLIVILGDRFEILAAGRPDYVVLQHAPARLEYDGFPGYVIQPLNEQIAAIEMISGKKVIAITLNHEEMKADEIAAACEKITKETGLLCTDVLHDGADKLVELIKTYL